jgi:hypothetical protein
MGFVVQRLAFAIRRSFSRKFSMPAKEGIASTLHSSPFKVLVLGGSYAGLGAALNLLDLCEGRSPRFTSESADTSKVSKIPVKITLVDEKDGYCKCASGDHRPKY